MKYVRPHTHPRAFTLMELLVAVSITMVMLFLINRLFFDTSNAVGIGIATSDMISGSRVIGEQLQRDAAAIYGRDGDAGMAGVQPGGFIVVLNARIPNASLRGQNMVMQNATVRSDQLLFVRYRDGAKDDILPVCPGDKTQYAPRLAADAQFARIWYGHLCPTLPNGTDPQMNDATDTLDDGEPLMSESTDLTRIPASDWLIGRQALFLDGTAAYPAPLPIVAEASPNTQSARYITAVQNYGATNSNGYPAGLPDSGAFNLPLFMGLTDVAHVVPSSGTRTPMDEIRDDLLSGSGYPTQAYLYTYGIKRLRANPAPLFSSTTYHNYEYASWQLAQMHPILMHRVSDFIVQFAGDFDATSGIDVDANGEIEWYDIDNPPPSPPPAHHGFHIDTTASRPALADAAYVWEHARGPGAIPTENSNSDLWPYLIRVRYRVHDNRGNLSDPHSNPSNPTPGRWFEVIIPTGR